VAATTGLKELVGEEPRLPGEAARELAQASHAGRVGVLFGCERVGLSAEQVALAQRRVRIPTFADCPSMNVSHAVAVMAWELHQASGQVGSHPAEPPATFAEQQIVMAKLEAALKALPYGPEGRRRSLLGGMKEFLDRRAMSRGDAQYLFRGLNLLVKRLEEGK
jgi:tRNA/rRNA methyltransferase